ncbi:MAG: chitinase [Butyrivibrio sp.]|nr:chitinase [Butyrivibrio sp.]
MKKKVLPVIIIIALIIIIGAVTVAPQIYEKISYGTEWADLESYFGVNGDSDVPIVLQNELIEEHAKLLDGFYYLDFSSVQKYLNDRFYYGKEDGILVYTTPTSIITASVGSNEWNATDGNSGSEEYQISRYEDDTLYVALEYVKKYTNFEYHGFTDPNHLQLTTKWEEQTAATIKKDTMLRLRGGVKSEILEELTSGDEVIILEQMETWTKVKTASSFIGYVENKRLSESYQITPEAVTDYTEPEYTSISKDYTINMGFHGVGGLSGNDTLESLVSSATSLNTVSPTWFTISDNDGNIISYASESYVTKAHNLGLEVWALVDNFTSPQEIDTGEVLSHAASRATLISNLINQAVTYNLDGINVDFELVASENGQDFVEFIRELSIACRAQQIVLSIDNYVPMNFNDYYDIEEQGIVADYVVIMGYDEHYAGSEEAGSVASISYVQNGIADTVAEVDPSKVINAIPFYTRIWTTSGGSVSSEAVSMEIANNWVANHNVELVWNEDAGQYYGEYTDDSGALYQVWMEDAESITTKLSVMSTYNIAGVAEWKLGFETVDIWDVIANYVNK